MPKSDLEGKTVMIAQGSGNRQVSCNGELFSSLKSTLEQKGATVVLSKHSPMELQSVPLIAEEVARHEPKIDALIVHNSDLTRTESGNVAVNLVKQLNNTLPVIVHDWNDTVNFEAIKSIRGGGGKYVNFNPPYDRIAFAVSDAIAQSTTTRRAVGV